MARCIIGLERLERGLNRGKLLPAAISPTDIGMWWCRTARRDRPDSRSAP